MGSVLAMCGWLARADSSPRLMPLYEDWRDFKAKGWHKVVGHGDYMIMIRLETQKLLAPEDEELVYLATRDHPSD